jgi:hypothetical protein
VGSRASGSCSLRRVGQAIAEEILDGAASIEPYRLERFAGSMEFPETVRL